MMEYPSRSNLNSLIVVLRGASAEGAEFRFHSGLSTSVEWGKPLSLQSGQDSNLLRLCHKESASPVTQPWGGAPNQWAPDYFGTGVSRSHLSLLNYSWFVVIKNSNPSIKKKLLPSFSEPVPCRSLINRLLLLRLNNPRPRQTRKKTAC
jgi:hypothetical protein